jgi:5'-nucleotidase
MKILLTNDDGIDAPGLCALAQSINGDFEQIIAAPHIERSGCSHATTTESPIQMHRRSATSYAVEGTPADCVRVALHEFEGEIDCVLAGINSGGNLGVDVYHSGTVAAVREAVLHGVPGISVSHYRNRKLTAADWARAARWAAPLIADILSRPSDRHTLWNINLPCLPTEVEHAEVVECALDLSPLPLQFRREATGLHYSGSYSKRARTPGADVDVCFSGKIALTKISLVG